MRLFRRPSTTAAAPTPTPPTPSLLDLVRRFRAQLAREAQQAPSVDDIQQRDATEQERRNAAGQERIARAVAKTGAWFPGD